MMKGTQSKTTPPADNRVAQPSQLRIQLQTRRWLVLSERQSLVRPERRWGLFWLGLGISDKKIIPRKTE
jgi:hypothetical protein